MKWTGVLCLYGGSAGGFCVLRNECVCLVEVTEFFVQMKRTVFFQVFNRSNKLLREVMFWNE